METIGEAVAKNASLEKENLLKGFERQLKKRFLKQQPWRTQHKIMKTTSSRQPPRKPARGELVQTRDVDDAVSTSSGTTAFPHTPHTILETNMHPLKPLGKMENSSKHLNRNPMRPSCCGLPGTSSKAMGNQSKKIKSMLNSTTPSFLITPSFLTRLKRHRVAWASCQMPVIVQDSQQREREWERDNCFSNRSSPSCLPCIRNLPTAQKAKSCIGPLPWICSECNLVCFFCNWGGPMQNSDPANLGGYMNALTVQRRGSRQQEKGRCSN